MLSEAETPMWVTELTVHNDNVTERAICYAKALKLFFSHPEIRGILVWGFWDGAHYSADAALAEGDLPEV